MESHHSVYTRLIWNPWHCGFLYTCNVDLEKFGFFMFSCIKLLYKTLLCCITYDNSHGVVGSSIALINRPLCGSYSPIMSTGNICNRKYAYTYYSFLISMALPAREVIMWCKSWLALLEVNISQSSRIMKRKSSEEIKAFLNCFSFSQWQFIIQYWKTNQTAQTKYYKCTSKWRQSSPERGTCHIVSCHGFLWASSH